jgi:IS1 family transposase
MANNLPFDRQVEIISALTEGVSIRATERLTGVHRDTIMRLGVRVGVGCDRLHNTIMRGLRVRRLELDEAWSFVGKKQKRVREGDVNVGDQYVFIALAGAAKAIVCYRVGKRTLENTKAFLWDVRERVFGAPEIITDGWNAYPSAVEEAFGVGCAYSVIEKHYNAPHARRSRPALLPR